MGEQLRLARRAADLSQRELAERSMVPRATLARAELGNGRVGVGVVVALLRACGWGLLVTDDQGRPSEHGRSEEARDRGGRRFPAHLDVRSIAVGGRWWGDPYLGAHGVPPRPLYTFDLNRGWRDVERRLAAGEQW